MICNRKKLIWKLFDLRIENKTLGSSIGSIRIDSLFQSRMHFKLIHLFLPVFRADIATSVQYNTIRLRIWLNRVSFVLSIMDSNDNADDLECVSIYDKSVFVPLLRQSKKYKAFQFNPVN